MADRILTTDEFVQWHDNYDNFRYAGFDKINAIYEIFRKNGDGEDVDVDICYNNLPDDLKLEVSKIIIDESLNEAVEIHDQLNPKIWTEEKELRPEVRAKILQIVDKFQSQLLVDKVELKIEDIYILGSNANYNYTEESDLDVHIIADESFDCSAEHLPLLYNCYKALFNSKYDIRIKGINVELYVENKDKLSNVSAGIYSLKEGWIRNPAEYEIPEFDQLAVDKEVQKWEDKYYEITENPSIKKIDDYIDGLYELRKDSIQNGEFAEGNLVFKEIRRRGYLDDLKELKVDLTSQELSLEALEEGQTKLRYHYRGPVYHFNFCISEDWEAYTEAVSDKQALNNLTVKAKKDFDFVLQSRVTLNPDYLELVTGEDDIPDEKFKPVKKCEKCGHELTDAGECPVCDLGDRTALEEGSDEVTCDWNGLGHSHSYELYIDWLKDLDPEDKEDFINDVKTNKALSDRERELLLNKVSESLNEDLIVVEPKDAKIKLTALKNEIEKAEGQTKEFLTELMDIYLYQTYKPSDRENSSINDGDWQEFADWLKTTREETTSVEIPDEVIEALIECVLGNNLNEELLDEGFWSFFKKVLKAGLVGLVAAGTVAAVGALLASGQIPTAAALIKAGVSAGAVDMIKEMLHWTKAKKSNDKEAEIEAEEEIKKIAGEQKGENAIENMENVWAKEENRNNQLQFAYESLDEESKNNLLDLFKDLD